MSRFPFTFVLLLGSAAAMGQTIPYPFPYTPPRSIKTTMVWSAPVGSSIDFTFPASADIRNGELQYVNVTIDFPYPTFNATVVSRDQSTPGVDIARMTDTYKLSAPSLDINVQFPPATIHGWWLGGPVPPVFTYNNTPYFLGSGSCYSPYGPQFDVFHPDAYAPKYLGATAGTLSVQSVHTPLSGSFNDFSEHVDDIFSLNATFREWKVNEVLAQRARPDPSEIHGLQVHPVPRFNFTFDTKEVANLGQYDHFNWYQEVVGFRTGVSATGAGAWMTSAQMKAYINQQTGGHGRGFGPDPLSGGNPGSPYGADASPLYWDEVAVPGRLGLYFWPAQHQGVNFSDFPHLLAQGDQVSFMTALVGVRADHSFDLLYKTGIPNADDFLFRWTYTQSTPTVGISVFLDNADPALGGGGTSTLLGNGIGDARWRYLLPGDANGDGKVDFKDLVIVAQHYNAEGQDYPTGDFDSDGKVAFSDLVVLAQHYGTSFSGAGPIGASAEFNADLAAAFATVPEPVGILPLLIAVAVLYLGRPSRRRAI